MKRILAILLSGLLMQGMTVAAEADSETTKVDIGACTFLHPQTEDLRATCPGVGGTPMSINVVGMNMFVSYGADALDEKAAKQTPPLPNYLGLTQEWRLGDDGKPRATIMPWMTPGADDSENEVLVVTQIKPGATCHIAYLDATASPGAMEVARRIADGAGGFDCANAPEVVQPFKAW
jgi:hypothetical protein